MSDREREREREREVQRHKQREKQAPCSQLVQFLISTLFLGLQMALFLPWTHAAGRDRKFPGLFLYGH